MAYQEIVIETYRNYSENSKERVRARPLPGQGLSTEMKVECSSKMRNSYSIGTKILIECKVTDRKGGIPFLYAHFNSSYRILNDEEAVAFIRSRYGQKSPRFKRK